MNFELESLPQFKKQVSKLDEKSRKKIKSKLLLIKQNPFRFKKIHSKSINRVFRVRLKLSGKEKRLIYVVLNPRLIIVCLIDRDKGYNDLEKYLSKVK